MLIARIVQSNSHLDYAARVLDSMETPHAPTARDYSFGQFVTIGDAVGIVYDSHLINPEFGNFGPRLSTPTELNAIFSPDFISEQGVLLSILLLGWRDGGNFRQGVPRAVLPIHAPVESMSVTDILSFHRCRSGALTLAYYSTIITHAKLFAHPLLESIIELLDADATGLAEAERARLRILRQSLAWQQTVESMR